MRTNIEIDDRLMVEAQRLTGLKTKRETVEKGLESLINIQRQTMIRKFRGKLQWEGDLEKLRTDV
jgi:Arc/MetJ family transcription regulator